MPLSMLKTLAALILVNAWFITSASGYEAGMQLGKNGRPHWNLDRKLGSGFFGNVFQTSDIAAPDNQYAIKMFKDKGIGNRALEHYTRIFDFFRINGNHPNILNLGLPEIYEVLDRDQKPAGEATVLFFEISEGSVENLIERFRPATYDTPRDKREKYKRLGRLKQDIVEAISFLYIHGVSHYDLNPRNILVDGNRYLVGDLDSVAPLDSKPMTSAWEIFYAPPEWADGGKSAKYSLTHLGDVWSLASVLYFALFGEPPLRDYYLNFAPPSKDKFAQVRAHMRDHPELHVAFDDMVKGRIADFRKTLTERNGVFDTDYANISSVLTFIEAGLQRDLLDRQTEVVKIIPTFAIKRGDACWQKFDIQHAM